MVRLMKFYIQILLHVTEGYQLLSQTSGSFRGNISLAFLNCRLVKLDLTYFFFYIKRRQAQRQRDLLWMVRVLVYMFSDTGTTLRRNEEADKCQLCQIKWLNPAK